MTNEPAWDGGNQEDPWPEASDVSFGRPRWHFFAAGGAAFVIVCGAILFFVRSGPEVSEASEVLAETVVPTSLPTVSTTTTTTVFPGTAGDLVELSESLSISQTGPPVACLGGTPGENPIEDFLVAALSQQGLPYEFGAEVDPADANPASFDTSELVEWSLAQAGVTIPDGSWLQYLALRDCGTDLSVEEALVSPGALIFGFSSEPTEATRPSESFVTISIGNGFHVVDAAEGLGVIVRPFEERELTHAARIPDLGTAQLILDS